MCLNQKDIYERIYLTTTMIKNTKTGKISMHNPPIKNTKKVEVDFQNTFVRRFFRARTQNICINDIYQKHHFMTEHI